MGRKELALISIYLIQTTLRVSHWLLLIMVTNDFEKLSGSNKLTLLSFSGPETNDIMLLKLGTLLCICVCCVNTSQYRHFERLAVMH